MRIPLQQVAWALGAIVDGDAAVAGWSVDTRTIQPGDVFFALRGPNHDGHDHVAAAFEKGALAAIVDRDVAVARPGDAILFKGSRGTHVEKALERFLG